MHGFEKKEAILSESANGSANQLEATASPSVRASRRGPTIGITLVILRLIPERTKLLGLSGSGGERAIGSQHFAGTGRTL